MSFEKIKAEVFTNQYIRIKKYVQNYCKGMQFLFVLTLTPIPFAYLYTVNRVGQET